MLQKTISNSSSASSSSLPPSSATAVANPSRIIADCLSHWPVGSPQLAEVATVWCWRANTYNSAICSADGRHASRIFSSGQYTRQM